jgi:hypothetical protein
MQSWTEVRLQMLAWGYRCFITVEIHCPYCGIFRAELWEEHDYYVCQGCKNAAKVAHVIEGYTRRSFIKTEWQQLEKPLSDKARRWIESDAFFVRPIIKHRKLRARAEETALRAFKRGQKLGAIDTRSATR